MQQRWVDAGHRVRRPQRVPTLSDAAALAMQDAAAMGRRRASCSPATACADAKRCSSDGSTPGIVLPIVCRRQASCSPATACADAKRCSSVGSTPGIVFTLPLSDAAALGRRRAPYSPATACADAKRSDAAALGRCRASRSPATACADAKRCSSVGSTPGIVFAGHSVCRR